MAVENVLHVIRCKYVASIRRLRARMTMFKQISMTNFKSWRETGPVRMAPLTAFFGANSSGKSSLLQMLLLLKQTAESNDENLVLKTGSLQPGYVNLGTAHEITYGDTTKMILGCEFDTDIPLGLMSGLSQGFVIKNLAFEVEIYADRKSVHVDALSYRDGDDFVAELIRVAENQYDFSVLIRGEEPRRREGFRSAPVAPVKCYGFSNDAFRGYRDFWRQRYLGYEFEEQFSNLHYLGPLREYPHREYRWGGEKPGNVGRMGELSVAALIADGNMRPSQRKDKKPLVTKIAQWLSDLGLAASFSVVPVLDGSTLYNVWIKRDRASPEVLLPDLGFGVSQILPVLVLCYYAAEGSTIILEQPELHLHPSVQAGLADVFVDVIKHRNVQILLESHSEHLLRRLQRRIAEEALKPDDIALYFCEMREGESTLTRLETDMFGAIKNWPQDFFGDMTGDIVSAIDAGYERKKANAIAG